MNLQPYIQQLHSFSVPTRITEIGCGVTLSNLLFSENHASSTVYEGHQPYSRESQLKLNHNLAYNRAISVENTLILLKESFISAPECPLHYVANFQIGGNPEKNQTTHGYIAIAGVNKLITIYHITIPGESTRTDLLNQIGEVGFSILFNKQLKETGKRKSDTLLNVNHVDQVFQQNDINDVLLNQDIDLTLSLFEENNIPVDEDNFLCYRNGKFHRFEDFFRDKKKVMFYRGTFNPITKAHLELFNRTYAQETPDELCLMIAQSIYSKPGLSVKDIKERMAYVDALNLPLVIAKSYRYLDAVKHYRKRVFGNTDIELQFIMGEDTVSRLFNSEPKDFYLDTNLINVTYLYVKRIGFELETKDQLLLDYLLWGDSFKFKNIYNFNEKKFSISATQARQYLQEGDFASLSKLLPIDIYNIFTKRLIDGEVK